MPMHSVIDTSRQDIIDIHQHDNHWFTNYTIYIHHFIFQKLIHNLFYQNIPKTCLYDDIYFAGIAVGIVQVHLVLSHIDMA